MSADPTRDLVRELASDLTPVKPLPRLRFVAAAVLLAWLAIALLSVALKGLAPDFFGTLARPLSAGGIFAGLLLGGLGGALGALALAIPGRERLAHGGLALCAAGSALAIAVGLAIVARGAPAAWRPPVAGDLACLLLGLAVGIVPALSLAWFGGRAAPFRPLTLALAAAAGAAALGGSVAQACCAVGEPMHLLLGHALVPALGAFALALPLLLAIRGSERRQSS
ncbi:MAG TPA: NrsF family protein [Myxococcota bacterium]|nr:NrsF family protein [Myxococcota bacterium]